MSLTTSMTNTVVPSGSSVVACPNLEPPPSYEEGCRMEWGKLNEDPYVTQARELLVRSYVELAKTKQELAKAEAGHPETGEHLPNSDDSLCDVASYPQGEQ